MPYASAADIHREFPGTLIPATDSTNNSVDDVALAAWLDEASALIDSQLSSVYQLPIIGTQSLLILKTICINLVAWRFAKVTDEKNDLPLPGANQPWGAVVPQTPNVMQGKKEAMAQLVAIQGGQLTLPDSTQLVGLSSYTVDTFGAGPKFRVDAPSQW